MKYAVMLCYWNDKKIIKDVEMIKVRDIETAFDITSRNLETNVIIPINKHNKAMLKKLIKFFN